MFYIGQNVVAIRDHKFGLFKEGDKFTVLNIKKSFCGCCSQLIDIGKERKFDSDIFYCSICEKESAISGLIAWFGSYNFAPLETYRESYSIAIELVQELEQVDKQKIFNPKKVEIWQG